MINPTGTGQSLSGSSGQEVSRASPGGRSVPGRPKAISGDPRLAGLAMPAVKTTAIARRSPSPLLTLPEEIFQLSPTSQIQSLEQQLAESQAMHKAATDTLNQHLLTIDTLKLEQQALQARFDTVKERLATNIRELARVKAELTRARAELTRTESEEKLQKDRDDAVSQLEDYKKTYTEIEEKLAEESSKFETEKARLQKEVSRLEEGLKASSEALKKTKKELGKKNNQINVQSGLLSLQETETREQTAQIQKLKSTLEQKEQEYRTTLEQTTSDNQKKHQEAVSHQNQLLADQQARQKELETQITDLKEQLFLRTEETRRLHDENQALQGRISSLTEPAPEPETLPLPTPQEEQAGPSGLAMTLPAATSPSVNEPLSLFRETLSDSSSSAGVETTSGFQIADNLPPASGEESAGSPLPETPPANIDQVFSYARSLGIPQHFVALGYPVTTTEDGTQVTVTVRGDLGNPADFKPEEEEQVLEEIGQWFPGDRRGGLTALQKEGVDKVWHQASFLEFFVYVKCLNEWLVLPHQEVIAKLRAMKTRPTSKLFSKTERAQIAQWQIDEKQCRKQKNYHRAFWPLDWLTKLAAAIRENPDDKLAQLAGCWADFSIQMVIADLPDEKQELYRSNTDRFNWRKLGQEQSSAEAPSKKRGRENKGKAPAAKRRKL